MKTTKNTVLAKKVQKLVEAKRLNKTSLVYGWLNEVVNGSTQFRPVFSQGNSWKNSSLVDKTREFEAALRLLGLNFLTVNDAPRGGKTGVRIDIVTKVLS